MFLFVVSSPNMKVEKADLSIWIMTFGLLCMDNFVNYKVKSSVMNT